MFASLQNVQNQSTSWVLSIQSKYSGQSLWILAKRELTSCCVDQVYIKKNSSNNTTRLIGHLCLAITWLTVSHSGRNSSGDDLIVQKDVTDLNWLAGQSVDYFQSDCETERHAPPLSLLSNRSDRQTSLLELISVHQKHDDDTERKTKRRTVSPACWSGPLLNTICMEICRLQKKYADDTEQKVTTAGPFLDWPAMSAFFGTWIFECGRDVRLLSTVWCTCSIVVEQLGDELGIDFFARRLVEVMNKCCRCHLWHWWAQGLIPYSCPGWLAAHLLSDTLVSLGYAVFGRNVNTRMFAEDVFQHYSCCP